jgi:uncharacterized protein (TIGR02145 family)
MRIYYSGFGRRELKIVLVIFILLGGCIKDKEDAVTPVHETGTMTDVDGNVYATVKIGNQWWMAENLKVTKYRNGYFIPNITDTSEWQNRTAGACCEFDPNEHNLAKPGLLYNWFVIADTGNIAPEGWHIPSDDEWKELERQLGMSATEAEESGWRGTHEGEKLRIAGTEGWSGYSDVWATNESGFTALAGSCRLPTGIWGYPGLHYTGFWWSQSASGNVATYRYLDYKNANIFRGQCSKNYGYSIRCVKD